MHEVHPYRKAHPHSRLLLIEIVFYLGFVVFLFLLCGFVTNASPGSVLLSFAPAILLGFALLILLETDHFNPTYNWLVAVSLLVVATIFYFGVPTATVQGIDAGTVLMLNALLMAAGIFIIHSSYTHEKPVLEADSAKHHKHTTAEVIVHHVQQPMRQIEQPAELIDVVHSIEDKVKALNFVIGRVYSVYHGGTERLRAKIRIEKEWYDNFNLIDENDFEKKRHEAIVLLQKIHDRLVLLEKNEKEIFGDDVEKLKNIQHHPAGFDKVIDVLVKNDKDPVLKYYDGAKQFCAEAIQALKTVKH